jgi:ABC-type glycerol-3-phosphate transport system substrate-binding protein
MKVGRRMAVLLAAVLGTALALVGATANAAPAHKVSAKATTVRIWADQDRKASVTKIANEWAAKTGATVDIVVKAFPPTQNLAFVRGDGA